jgi:hypothetical protein
VFTRRSLSVVLVTNNDPRDVVVSVVAKKSVNTSQDDETVQSNSRSDLRDGSVLASNLVKDLVGLTVIGVDGTDQTVLCTQSVDF